MANNEFDVYCVKGGGGGAGGRYDYNSEIANYYEIISNLRKMKCIQEMVVHEMNDGNQEDFHERLISLISDWRGQYPDLRKMFRPKEVDWLLTECMDYDNYEKLLNFVIESGYRDQAETGADGEPLFHRVTPIHQAVECDYDDFVRQLFEIYEVCEVNYVDERGFSHFHAACAYDCDNVVERFLELGKVDVNLIWRVTGESPLHMALSWSSGRERVAELLLSNGADPNLADDAGSTPLHVISERWHDEHELLKLFFRINDDRNQTVNVDARGASGNTPLHVALKESNKKVAELLLRRGADPSLANDEGSTCLHFICTRNSDCHVLAETFFKINAELDRPVCIDARDKLGNTPLHRAVFRGHERLTELLLRRDADPNLTNDEGLTPLHMICKREGKDDGLAKRFFEVVDDLGKQVRVDARDNSGYTPLQWAVANFLPDTVDALVDRGADLASFVFPAASRFDVDSKKSCLSISDKLKLAHDTRGMVERLERRGYELDRSDVATILNAFDKHEFFKIPADLEEHWYDDEKFVKTGKYFEMKPNVTLYDLVRLRPEAAEKVISYEEISKFLRSNNFYGCVAWKNRDACDAHLCAIITRRLYRRWALDPMMDLTRHKLPILCCDMIIEDLNNEDLRSICLAAVGQDS